MPVRLQMKVSSVPANLPKAPQVQQSNGPGPASSGAISSSSSTVPSEAGGKEGRKRSRKPKDGAPRDVPRSNETPSSAQSGVVAEQPPSRVASGSESKSLGETKPAQEMSGAMAGPPPGRGSGGAAV